MKLRMTAAALVLACLCAATGYAADTKTQPAKAAEQASPSAAEQKYMEWMQKNVPGDPHKKLAECVGEWNMEVKSWMTPNTPPSTSTGTSSAKMILDGRYLQETATGNMGGMPFSGMGLTGYDNATKKFQATWIDNMSTAIFRSEGTLDEKNKLVTMNGTTYDPMAGKEVPVKTTLRFIDDKSHVFEWWGPGPSGEMFKAMEITYTRK